MNESKKNLLLSKFMTSKNTLLLKQKQYKNLKTEKASLKHISKKVWKKYASGLLKTLCKRKDYVTQMLTVYIKQYTPGLSLYIYIYIHLTSSVFIFETRLYILSHLFW